MKKGIIFVLLAFFTLLPLQALGAKGPVLREKRVALFVRKGQESYVPSDYAALSEGHGGVHDVARQLARELDKRGISAFYSRMFLSGGATEGQVKTVAGRLERAASPDVIINLTRSEEGKKGFDFTLEDRQVTRVRLYASSANSSAESLAIAESIRAAAESMYPGLVLEAKQDATLIPIKTPVITVEIGSKESDKGRVFAALPMLAESLLAGIYGTTEVQGYYQVQSLAAAQELMAKIAFGVAALSFVACLFKPKRLEHEEEDPGEERARALFSE